MDKVMEAIVVGLFFTTILLVGFALIGGII